jgi:glycine cleavage system H protein
MTEIPDNCKYSETHEWFRPEGDIVTVGITQFAADELADITYLDLPSPGSRVEAGSPFGEIESVKATSELNSAVAGDVVETNAALGDAPELVNQDPFGKGWMVRIRMSNPADLDGLMDAAAYNGMLASG